ncbi:MAG: hypothetical protein JRE40_13395 [Deltaproteobacteria bacterium]|nr:hypothetical protein [Deltaproteobacteria bacterium]
MRGILLSVGFTAMLALGLVLLTGYYAFSPTPSPRVVALAMEEAEAPPHVSMSLAVSKPLVKVGEVYEVRVSVSNHSYSPIIGVLEVSAEDTVEQMWKVTLGGGESREYSYTTVKTSPGEYAYRAVLKPVPKVAIAEASTSIRVCRPSDLSVSVSSPLLAASGREFTISVVARNSGPVGVSGVLKLVCDSAVFRTFDIVLPPGGEERFEVPVTKPAGVFTFEAELEVDGVEVSSNEVSVSVTEPGEKVSLGLSASVSEAGTGEEYTVTVAAGNPSEYRVEGTLEVLEGGAVVKTFAVVLQPGENKEYSCSFAKSEAGVYSYSARVSVDGVTKTTDSVFVSVVGLRAEDISLALSAPESVRVGSTFALTITVKNSGSVEAAGTLSVEGEGVVISTLSVSLNPGEERVFSISRSEGVGIHSYAVSTEFDGVLVTSGPVSVRVYELGEDVSVTLGASDSEVLVGEQVQVQCVVANGHEEPVEGILSLYRDGNIVETYSVSLGPGEKKTYVYSFTPAVGGTSMFVAEVSAGAHTHRDELEVRAVSLAGTLEINLAVPDSVRPNEPYEVSVSVVNGRNAPISGELEILAGPKVENRAPVSLRAGENVLVKYETFKESEGTYAYVAKLKTPEAEFSSQILVLEVANHPLYKLSSVAGSVGNVPVLPAFLSTAGVAGVLITRKGFIA